MRPFSKDQCLVQWNVADTTANKVFDMQRTISAATLRDVVFKPFLTEIYDTINRVAIVAPRKVHLLCSGILSDCPYILKCLEQSIIESNPKAKVEILKSVNGYDTCPKLC
jgi:hypothetical protein